MVRTKLKEQELKEVFKNPEFSRYADELLGVIERHFRMIEGRNADKEERLQVAIDIIKERLND